MSDARSSAGIFIVQPDGKLLALSESPYDSEDVLQLLLERYPALLAGHQVDAERPRRWLLVKRELGIPDGDGAAVRWSLDHLFLDQDAVPTLVEVKRSTDTRIRREVVGQMLDYAANAVAFWPAERLQSEFEGTVAAAGQEPSAVLREFLQDEFEPETFWSRAKTNLQAGRLRLVFVADEIPVELRRIIEFLNEQMDPAEVLGVEIKQYTGGGVQSLVPRVIGQTAEAEQRKGAAAQSREWNDESFFAVLGGRSNPAESRIARSLLDWAKGHKLRIAWGRGAKEGSFYMQYDLGRFGQYTISVRTGLSAAYVQFQFGAMTAPFDNPTVMAELKRRIQDAVGHAMPEEAKYPSLRLVELELGERLPRFLQVLDWVLAQYAETAEATVGAQSTDG